MSASLTRIHEFNMLAVLAVLAGERVYLHVPRDWAGRSRRK
jgi:hypothetical protein